MSVKIMAAAWGLTLPDSEKIVLLALADYADNGGICWPAIATIATKCCKSERTVQSAIKSLVASGHLSREEKIGKGCFYAVHPRKDCTPAEISPPQPLHHTPAALAPHPRSACTPPPQPLHPNHHGTTIEPSLNHIEAEHPEPTAISKIAKVKVVKADVVLPGWMPVEAWNGWLDMRRGKRAPASSRALSLAITKLTTMRQDGQDPAAVLDQSTLKGWTDLYPLKGANNDRNNRSKDDVRNPMVRAALARRFGENGNIPPEHFGTANPEQGAGGATGSVYRLANGSNT